MIKDMEMIMENQHLEDTIKIINDEILNYLKERKVILDYIVDYRKKAIEEFKDDEDKVIDYFDHERYVKEEAFKNIDKKLKEYNILKESPYFGRVMFNENDEGVEDIYIGRFGVTTAKDFEPIVVDWRAPIASLFYKGTLGDAKYQSPRAEIEVAILGRRQIIIKKGELKGLFDSAVDVKDDILQMALSTNSSEKLKDIVMTIQEEQDEIIRAPKNNVVVVNGVAGSGKTTIALHRVSYLLYNNRKQLGNKVLVLGPNDIFMDYISQVLPSLGEDGIEQTTFQNFALNEIGIDYEITGFSKYIEESMSGNESYLDDYKYKGSKAFVDFLDNKLEEMKSNYFNIEPVIFWGDEIVSKDEIIKLFNEYYKYMPLFRRSEKVKRIIISKIKDKRDELVRKLNQEIKDKISKLSKEDYEIEKNNLDFKRRIKIREIIREVMNLKDKLDLWISHEDITSLYMRITNTEKISYIDLSGILYLLVKLEGKKCSKEIKHIVIDEAQDYTMLQFKVIKELTGCNSYTIVGDSNQRLIEVDEEPAMLNLDKIFDKNVVNYSLNKSYRSTQEIMEYANRFIKEDRIVPLVRHGEAVIEEETSSDEETVQIISSIIEDYEEEGLESIAIITKDSHKLKHISKLLKEKMKILTFDRDDIVYTGGRVILPAYYAKGLEFDGVIILDKFDNTKDLVKYIMCTRALHRLSIIDEK